MAIIVFQHGEGGPGRLGLTLRDHGFKLDVRRLDLPPEAGGKPVPPDFDNVEGVVSLGGKQDVTEEDFAKYPWLAAEAAYLREAHERQLPVVGICLGAQLIAHALGGKVARMAKPELGFHPLSLNPLGQTETILAGIAWESPQFQSHFYEVAELPPGATVLGSSALCRNQVFRAGIRTYGFQYHFECDRAGIEQMMATHADGLAQAGLSAADLAAQCDAHYGQFARLGDRLCVNIASYAFPFQRKLSA